MPLRQPAQLWDDPCTVLTIVVELLNTILAYSLWGFWDSLQIRLLQSLFNPVVIFFLSNETKRRIRENIFVVPMHNLILLMHIAGAISHGFWSFIISMTASAMTIFLWVPENWFHGVYHWMENILDSLGVLGGINAWFVEWIVHG
ncbi:hypothetical protein BJ875DRAFT_487992 [Amylocarpus encephaloides]|uniref:Uncharacterized protein n=1 Tax=Amylocarpus encephaloides TaxID=45428 RepID=A0A9P7YBZ5_9HELO|nr:hypothetical protein BJ875DRAFT_487992 [Amylocarpus encephaloides]